MERDLYIFLLFSEVSLFCESEAESKNWVDSEENKKKKASETH